MAVPLVEGRHHAGECPRVRAVLAMLSRMGSNARRAKAQQEREVAEWVVVEEAVVPQGDKGATMRAMRERYRDVADEDVRLDLMCGPSGSSLRMSLRVDRPHR